MKLTDAIRLPNRFPKGTTFWTADNGDVLVEVPRRGVFKLADNGAELVQIPGLPAAGLVGVREGVFRMAASVQRDRTAVGQPVRTGSDWHSALVDMEHAIADLAEQLPAGPVDDDQLDDQILAAVEQVLASMSLKSVPVRTALQEIGFVEQVPGSPDLTWQTGHQGRALLLGAGPGPGEQWLLDGWVLGDPIRPAGESVELDRSEQRGAVCLAVLKLWRQVFGRGVRPPGTLEAGRLFEQYGPDAWRKEFGLPCMVLDGPSLRDARKAIRQRHPALPWIAVDLAMDGAAVRLDVCGTSYWVNAKGGLGVPATIWLDDLLAIPPYLMRGKTINVERGAAGLNIGWYVMPYR